MAKHKHPAGAHPPPSSSPGASAAAPVQSAAPVPLAQAAPVDVLTALAQNPTQSFEVGPRYQLLIENLDVSHLVKDVSVAYAGDGQSGMTFTVDGVLEGLGDSLVRLLAGYGSVLTEYFSGYLEEPDDDPYSAYAKAVAYGPFKLMGTQYFGEYTDLSNFTIGEVLQVCEIMAGFPQGTIAVLNPSSFRYSKMIFNEETTILEAASKAVKDADYVFVDRPGITRLAMPRPRPAAGIPAKAFYSERHYETGGFTVKPQPTTFSNVVVFHRATQTPTTQKANSGDGATLDSTKPGATQSSFANASQNSNLPVDDVRAVAPVHNPGKPPPANRLYWIPDFTGNQQAAQAVAYVTADALSRGFFEFELKAALNPALLMWDTIQVSRVKPKGAAYFRQTFQCTIEKSVKAEIKEGVFDMTLSGTAIQLYEEQIAVPAPPAPVPTTVLAVLPVSQPFSDWGAEDIWLWQAAQDYSMLAAPPAFTDWGQTDVTFDRLTYDFNELT